MLTGGYIFFASLMVIVLALFLVSQLRSYKTRQRKFDLTTALINPRIIGKEKWESLTIRQKQVARLAARGLSNAEIALQLSIKPNTVDAHLKKIYATLGVRSRAGLSYTIKDHID